MDNHKRRFYFFYLDVKGVQLRRNFSLILISSLKTDVSTDSSHLCTRFGKLEIRLKIVTCKPTKRPESVFHLCKLSDMVVRVQ